ncbi:MAG TPA: hypothetical protein VMF69_24605 [Gemmataceae bacterium]|nr:hypothetical protein [Gemmataceae bacterium]
MRTIKYFLAALMTMGLAAGLGVFGAADEDKPKYDIEEIMQKAHKAPKGKTPLLQQVAKGKANEKQKEQLLEYYEELAKNKPPKGSKEDWKKRTKALVSAAKEAVAGKATAGKALTNAAKCGDCHKAHRED